LKWQPETDKTKTWLVLKGLAELRLQPLLARMGHIIGYRDTADWHRFVNLLADVHEFIVTFRSLCVAIANGAYEAPSNTNSVSTGVLLANLEHTRVI
jgi:hypothetical protein